MTKVNLSELNKKLLNDTLMQLKTMLQAQTSSLFIFDGERQELVLNAVMDERKSRFAGMRQRLGDGIAGSVATLREAVLVKDIRKDPRFTPKPFHRYLTHSFISVPLTCAEGLLGVVNISDKNTGSSFSQGDLELACLAGRLIAQILESELRVQKLAQEIEALKDEKEKSRRERLFLEKFASLGRLASGIVHEINNPLDAVTRYTNLLIEKDLEKSVAREYLDEIKVGLTRMNKITRSLLEFSQQLKDSDRREDVDVNAAVEEALSLFRHQMFSGSVHVRKEYDELLPRIVDKGLYRVFSNLIKNAFDAMPEGGTLTVRTVREDGHIVVAFRDTGIGMDRDVLDKIFTPFFTTKAIGKGVGLGLPICFEVVQRYGGRIDVESVPGLGTTFLVRLPVSETPVAIK
ncbi:MAG: sensor histidine kinase [Deltaproteobacteria bacterium]